MIINIRKKTEQYFSQVKFFIVADTFLGAIMFDICFSLNIAVLFQEQIILVCSFASTFFFCLSLVLSVLSAIDLDRTKLELEQIKNIADNEQQEKYNAQNKIGGLFSEGCVQKNLAKYCCYCGVVFVFLVLIMISCRHDFGFFIPMFFFMVTVAFAAYWTIRTQKKETHFKNKALEELHLARKDKASTDKSVEHLGWAVYFWCHFEIDSFKSPRLTESSRQAKKNSNYKERLEIGLSYQNRFSVCSIDDRIKILDEFEKTIKEDTEFNFE